jgi:tRNA pseudouridine55 synthase
VVALDNINNNISGVVNVLKPAGMTSFDVVRQIRKIMHIKKVGHIGTLDPMASGVLPVCIGKATKIIEYLSNGYKVYRTEMTLGVSTDTQDSEGKILECSNVNCTKSEIENAILSFVGDYEQIPPMYSALKFNGKKLYEYARQGVEIQRKARDVHIYWIKIKNICENRAVFDVKCSKGTYIRTLCSDIGEKLKCGAHMSFLLRMENGIFNLDNAHMLEEIQKNVDNKNVRNVLIDIDHCIIDMVKVELSESDALKFANGGFIKIEKTKVISNEIVAVCDNEKTIIGFAYYVKRGEDEDIYLKPVKVL